MKTKFVLTFGLITLGSFLVAAPTYAAQASQPTSTPTASMPQFENFKVNGIVVSATQQSSLFKAFKKDNPKVSDGQISNIVRSLLTENAVYTSAVKSEKIAETPLYQIERMRLLSQLNARKLAEKFLADPKNKATEEELKNALNNLKKSYGDYEYTIQHIRVKTQEEALKVLKRVQGKASFEKVAKEVSIDPTRTKGGLLENISLSMLDPALATVVKNLPKGSIANMPIEIHSGWVIVKKISQRPQQRFTTLEKMKKEITTIVNSEKTKNYLRSLMNSAKIER